MKMSIASIELVTIIGTFAIVEIIVTVQWQERSKCSMLRI